MQAVSGPVLSDGKPYRVLGRKPSPYEKLTQAIMSGELAPGQALIETALAEWCEVSRTPVREALTRLEQDGMVVRGERGLMVRERSPEEILDLYETRIVLEAMAARVAATRRSYMDLITMRRIGERLEAMDTSDEHAMAAGNREFHKAIRQASHNDSLSDLLQRLDMHVARYPSTTLSQPGRWSEGNGEHREIITAIEAQDAKRAHDLTAAHFAKARELRLALWAKGQE
ncbi:GntR family transcriptional regulator [Modestobacter sp. VKM Ac-2979]|uniref:GntR family transcriptional regulator n=1 Tax=unclassified Modestobacter TaxID=2643866 RepID=UPI0022ABB181|nr:MULTISPECIES: GntR family transcriptional regulator [unclassified Modestobacter]MCZ2813938.1 GntR family transcriptional regulator [Modestobacter sp. VKM Ac-2979]MCZ2844647.1 GntR family transcriptional regulator [Modestobacter sp. VKM Ac-2980]